MIMIAIFGLRGYGAIYSGYETFIQYLVSISNKRNYFYYLFCRSRYKKYSQSIDQNNIELIHIPTFKGKHAETMSYNFVSTLKSIDKKIDIALYLGTANVIFIYIQKLLGRKTIVNTAGIDWQKKRWSIWGRLYLKMCERLTVIFADTIICDSKTVFKYYKNRYHLKNLVYIPYGAQVTVRKPGKVLKKFDLQPYKYIYAVGRISPENCFEDVIQSFYTVRTDFKCVIVGDSIYEDEYKKYLLKLSKKDKRIIFTGFLRKEQYEEICSHAYAYIEPKSIGGTHPSLLEAMAFGKPIIAKDIQEHKEVLKKTGHYYKTHKIKSLKEKIELVLSHPNDSQKYGQLGQIRVNQAYSWQKIISQYENTFNS